MFSRQNLRSYCSHVCFDDSVPQHRCTLRAFALLKMHCSVMSVAVRALHVNNSHLPPHCFRTKHRFILCNWNVAQLSRPRVFSSEYLNVRCVSSDNETMVDRWSSTTQCMAIQNLSLHQDTQISRALWCCKTTHIVNAISYLGSGTNYCNGDTLTNILLEFQVVNRAQRRVCRVIKACIEDTTKWHYSIC